MEGSFPEKKAAVLAAPQESPAELPLRFAKFLFKVTPHPKRSRDQCEDSEPGYQIKHVFLLLVCVEARSTARRLWLPGLVSPLRPGNLIGTRVLMPGYSFAGCDTLRLHVPG
jgi:hypothetical protein